MRKLPISRLDVTLALRMLLKYPGLTIVGGLAIAFAVALGATSFEFARQLLAPTLPLPAARGLIGIQAWDAVGAQAIPTTINDFLEWRPALRSVVELSAFRSATRILIVGAAGGFPIEIAEMTASGMRLARVDPVIGRPLQASDEAPGAPAVVVLGHTLWRREFGGDPRVVGKTVRFGRRIHTVIGVMPAGYGFPVAHEAWVALSVDALRQSAPGAAVHVMGRLDATATPAAAQAELRALAGRGDRVPRTANVRFDVLPYARSVMPLPEVGPAGLIAINGFLVALLVLVSANVALLMFARAAGREGEFVVRHALGASRSRLIAQLFTEALVLSAAAASAGVLAASFGLRAVLLQLSAAAGGHLPFWMAPRLSLSTVLYAGVLTVLGAGIISIVPALNATRRVETQLRAGAVRGSPKFGGMWVIIIVAQVAVTVVFPATAFIAWRYVTEMQTLDPGFRAQEYVSARLADDSRGDDGGMRTGTPGLVNGGTTGQDRSAGEATASVDGDANPLLQRNAEELARRLASDPAIDGITFTSRLPRSAHTLRRIAVEGMTSAEPAHELNPAVSTAVVALNYFDVLHAPMIRGRGFGYADLATGARTIVVNASFMREVLGGQNPIGRRLRFAAPEGDLTGPGKASSPDWYEIVGVAPDLGMVADDPHHGSGVYLTAGPGLIRPLHMIVHSRGDASMVGATLRAVAARIDPGLRVDEVSRLTDVAASTWTETAFLFHVLCVVSAVALSLSLSAIFAVTAFAVSKRTREIGIRVALGSDQRRVVTAIFAKPVAHVVAGLAVGSTLVAALTASASGFSVAGAALLAGYTALMLCICLSACIVPTRRALRIQPAEALRAD